MRGIYVLLSAFAANASLFVLYYVVVTTARTKVAAFRDETELVRDAERAVHVALRLFFIVGTGLIVAATINKS